MHYERITEIKDLLAKQGRVELEELKEKFPLVSTMTLRRDLIFLENRGEAVRVRGGAISPQRPAETAGDDEISRRLAVNAEKKKAICDKALSLVTSGGSIFIDSGSTALYFARNLPDVYYNIVTNGVNIALELAKKSMPQVTLLGGGVSRANVATTGNFAQEMLRHINVETAFLSSTAFSLESGFTCGNQGAAQLKRFVIEHAKHVVMLLDSSKTDKIMPYTFAALADVDVIVSDSGFPAALKAAAETAGVRVL